MFVLCGCTSKKVQEEITFSSWGSVSEVKIIKDVISNFEQENPNIKVKFIHIPQNYFQKLHLLFASNTAPDVIFINNLYLPIYASNLENLSDVVSKKEFYSQAIDGLSYNGALLAVPRDISDLVFYVNKDALKKFGINIPNENWTLSDLLDVSKQVSGMYAVSYEPDIYWVLPYLAYYGGGVLTPDGTNIIASDGSTEGLNYYRNLKKNGYAPSAAQVGSSTLAQMFLDGKVVFYLSGRWMYPKISEKANFDWGVVNFPYGKAPMPCDSSGWAISKTSKHKDSAYRFVQYLSSKKCIDEFTSTGLIVPARVDSAQSLNKDFRNEKIFLNVIKKSKNTPVNKDYKRIVDDINNDLQL